MISQILLKWEVARCTSKQWNSRGLNHHCCVARLLVKAGTWSARSRPWSPMTARFRWKGDAMAWLWRKNSEEWNGMFSFFSGCIFCVQDQPECGSNEKDVVEHMADNMIWICLEICKWGAPTCFRKTLSGPLKQKSWVHPIVGQGHVVALQLKQLVHSANCTML